MTALAFQTARILSGFCLAASLFLVGGARAETPAAAAPLASAPPEKDNPRRTAPPTATSQSAKVPALNNEDAIRQLLTRSPPLGCDYHGHHALGNQLLIACGALGVLRVDRTADGLEVSGIQRFPGSAIGFFLQGGQLWVRLVQEQAVVVGRFSDATARNLEPDASLALQYGTAPEPEKKKTATKKKKKKKKKRRVAVGSVVEVRDLSLLVDIGREDGLTIQQNVAIYPPTGELGPAEQAGEGSVVVGQIVELWDHQARVQLGVNEFVNVGDTARASLERRTASRRAPPRVQGVTEIIALGRPMLNLGTLGGGLFLDGSVGYRTDMLHFGAAVSPLGIASGQDEGTTVPWSAYVFGAFDTRSFEAGLGLGGQSVNDTSNESDKGSGLTLVQILRLGSIDGLYARSTAQVAIFRSETLFSTLQLEAQMAVSDSSWLQVRGGGGTVGYGYGEIALRNLLSGNGGAGSTFLVVGIGGAAAFEQHCATTGRTVPTDDIGSICEDKTVGGPMVVLGGEWRL